MVAGIFPLDGAVGGDQRDLAAVGIGAEEGMGGPQEQGQGQEQGQDTRDRGEAHGSIWRIPAPKHGKFGRHVFGLPAAAGSGYICPPYGTPMASRETRNRQSEEGSNGRQAGEGDHRGRETWRGDPEGNARLHAAVEKAKKASVTRDVIERAIAKGSGTGSEKMHLDHVVFEATRRTRCR